jgi:hypothetical protein
LPDIDDLLDGIYDFILDDEGKNEIIALLEKKE